MRFTLIEFKNDSHEEYELGLAEIQKKLGPMCESVYEWNAVGKFGGFCTNSRTVYDIFHGNSV